MRVTSFVFVATTIFAMLATALPAQVECAPNGTGSVHEGGTVFPPYPFNVTGDFMLIAQAPGNCLNNTNCSFTFDLDIDIWTPPPGTPIGGEICLEINTIFGPYCFPVDLPVEPADPAVTQGYDVAGLTVKVPCAETHEWKIKAHFPPPPAPFPAWPPLILATITLRCASC